MINAFLVLFFYELHRGDKMRKYIAKIKRFKKQTKERIRRYEDKEH